MFTQNRQKGFTLIELLVVVAIIGILASIVLASLNSARKKGQDGKVKSQVAQIAAAAEIYYDNKNGSYGITATTCTTASSMWMDTPSSMSKYAGAPAVGTWPGGIACNASGQAYAFMAQLASDDTKGFCIDSTGVTKTVTWATTLTSTVCP